MENKSKKEIEKKVIESLTGIGIKLHPISICWITEKCIEIGIPVKDKPNTISVKSSIKMYAEKNKLSYKTSGSFDESDYDRYWQTIHAASLLSKWKEVCIIVNEICTIYKKNFI